MILDYHFHRYTLIYIEPCFWFYRAPTGTHTHTCPSSILQRKSKIQMNGRWMQWWLKKMAGQIQFRKYLKHMSNEKRIRIRTNISDPYFFRSYVRVFDVMFCLWSWFSTFRNQFMAAARDFPDGYPDECDARLCFDCLEGKWGKRNETDVYIWLYLYVFDFVFEWGFIEFDWTCMNLYAFVCFHLPQPRARKSTHIPKIS